MDFEVKIDFNDENNSVAAFPISRMAVPIPSSDQSRKNCVATYFTRKVRGHGVKIAKYRTLESNQIITKEHSYAS